MKRRTLTFSAALFAVFFIVAAAVAYQYMPPPAAPAVTLPGITYSVTESSIGSLLENSQAKSIVLEHIPGFADLRQLSVAKPLTLPDIQPYFPNLITDAQLAAIQAELKNIEASGVVVYTTTSTLVGVILDDPEARMIVDKHLAGFSQDPRIDQGRGFTLTFMQKFDRDVMTDEKLQRINADFEALAKSRAGIE